MVTGFRRNLCNGNNFQIELLSPNLKPFFVEGGGVMGSKDLPPLNVTIVKLALKFTFLKL
jgi:hypothetical protein